jgi:hypothetical protein
MPWSSQRSSSLCRRALVLIRHEARFLPCSRVHKYQGCDTSTIQQLLRHTTQRTLAVEYFTSLPNYISFAGFPQFGGPWSTSRGCKSKFARQTPWQLLSSGCWLIARNVQLLGRRRRLVLSSWLKVLECGKHVRNECGKCSALQGRVIGGTEMPQYTAPRDKDRLWALVRGSEMGCEMRQYRVTRQWIGL